jgi:hypothetical protein
MPIRLNDDQCLLWIKDPSVSPFENDYVIHKVRKNIFSEATLKNPRSFLNNVKRKCFHNSAIRQQIIDKINEYRSNGTLRLNTLNNKLGSLTNIEYITPPFTRKECERWLSNHLENPRPIEDTAATAAGAAGPATYKKIEVGNRIYTELIYTTLQYGLPTPANLESEPPTLANKFDDKFQRTSYRNMNKLIKEIKMRLEFMRETDELFLNHNVGSFDEKLKIASPSTPRRKAATKTAKAIANIAINPFGVSSTTSKSLNSAERRQLRDIILEKKEEEKSVAIYQYKKGIAKGLAKDLAKGSKASNSDEQIDTSRKDVFIVFKAFLIDLVDAVTNGELINNILRNVSLENASIEADEAGKKMVIDVIKKYFDRRDYNNSYISRVLKENNYDTIEGILRNFINNMFIQLIDPATEDLPNELEIGVLSYSNKLNHLKKFFHGSRIYDMLIDELYNFIGPYLSVIDNKVHSYYIHLVNDTIVESFVAKRDIEVRAMTTNATYAFKEYQNFYYKILYTRSEEPPKIRLPSGNGLLIGKELTKKITDLDEPYFNSYPEDRVITNAKVRGFTYEECKNWVILPIFNPRTFKEIFIDSPIYNTLLVTSYQYDTDLIPRMITSRGHKILQALTEVIVDILHEKGDVAQSRDELEKFIIDTGDKSKMKKGRVEKKVIPSKIGLKWKNVGAKKPKDGVLLKELNGLLKSKGIVADRQPPFYLLFTEEELVAAAAGAAAVAGDGISTIAKNSYIEIAAYYVPDISVSRGRGRGRGRGSRARDSNIGLKWKKVVDLKEGEGIEKEGIEINNKKLKDAFLILKSLQGDLRPSVSFTKENLATFGITTAIAKNSYVKLAYYYKPVFEKSESDIKIKPTNHAVITKRDPAYVAYKYYTIADCLRWARQPNKDPKKEHMILTDSKEYNAIFEQALLYDYNITPINITAKGKKFKKMILKTRGENIYIAEQKKRPTSRGKDIADINSVVCNAINNIYDDTGNEEGKKYKKFKDLMIDRCLQYNKDPVMCITEIRNAIFNRFYPENIEYKLAYYQDSALASLLTFYNRMKDQIYKEEFRDIFIYNFNKFYVSIYEIDDDLNETKKDAIDAGGPKREFFTKLFEELFCDDEHLTRPFVCPVDIIGNKYYINPNFEPDANFLKVIAAWNKNHASMPEFKTERDYEYIYFVIGKLLCLPVYNEDIGLPKQFSSYILAGLIYQPIEFEYYDLLYFYLYEFNNAIVYIRMISKQQIGGLDYAELSFNDTYVVSRTSGSSQKSSGAKITTENCIKFILQQSKHVVSKNFLVKEEVNSNKSMKRRYDSLFAGFSNEMRKFLYEKRVTIEQLSSLITNEQLTEAILQELVDKIDVEIPEVDDRYYPVIIDPIEKAEKEREMKEHISNMIIRRRAGVSIEDHLVFIKKLLQYWTAFNYFNRRTQYKIIYKYGQGIDIKRFPSSHTCFNAIDVYGFPDNTTPQEKEKFIYDKFKIAVEATGMELR